MYAFRQRQNARNSQHPPALHVQVPDIQRAIPKHPNENDSIHDK